MLLLSSCLAGLNALILMLMRPPCWTGLTRCCMICQGQNGTLYGGRCLILTGIRSGIGSMLFSRQKLQAMLFQLMSLF